MAFRFERSLLMLPAVAAALMLATACDSRDEQAKRREAVRTLVDAVRLEPAPGTAAIRIAETRSEADAPYYSTTGTLPGDRAAAVTLLNRTLRDQGWDVFESAAVDDFLGWRMRGVHGSMVARVFVGWSDVSPGAFNPFPRRPGRVWIQVHVGRKGSNQVWTKVD